MKLYRFLKAVIKRYLYGRDLASEEIDARYAICISCSSFVIDNNESLCGECGCPLKPSNQSGRNKLKWSTEKCPLDKWV